MRMRVYGKAWGLFFIGVGVFVWMTGFLGNTYIRLISEPKMNNTQSISESNSAQEVQVKLAELNYWTCQVGVFQAAENAGSERERFEQLGWETQIVSQSPWIVAIGFAHDQGQLNGLQERLKEGEVTNVVKHFSVPEQAYKVSGSGAEQTAQILLTVHSFLKTAPGQRGDSLIRLEKEMATSWPQKLGTLQQATAYVIKAERTLDFDSQRLAALKLFAEYQNSLISLKNDKKY